MRRHWSIALAATLTLVCGGCPDQSSDVDLAQIRSLIEDQVAEQVARGITGERGERGEHGEKGVPGTPGSDGVEGPEGPRGLGVSFVVDAGGVLTVAPGDQVTLDGTETKPQTGGEFSTAELTNLWEQVDESGNAVTLADADQPQASFTVPAEAKIYLLEFRLTVTDPNGIFATDEVIILVAPLDLPQVNEAPLVGGGVEAGSNSASLEVAVSVLDANGDLISNGLTTANFAFQNLTLTLEGGGASVSVTSATVDRVEIRPPSAGGALTAILDFDSSGSMDDNDGDMSGRKAGGNAFIDLMDGNDEMAILDFGAGRDNGLSDSRLLQEFTDDEGLLRADQLRGARGKRRAWDTRE